MRFIFPVLIACATMLSLPAVAETRSDVYDIPEPVAIQARRYKLDQSFNFGAGFIPSDTFNRGYPLSIGYRQALTPYLTWEVLDYSTVFNSETKTKKDLQNLNVQVQNVGLGGVLDYPSEFYVTGLHYSPMYSKNLLFNSKLVYSETMLYLGAGAIHFHTTGTVPTLVPGLSSRLYVSPNSALNLFFRAYVYKDTNVGINAILSIGISFETRFRLFGESLLDGDKK